MSMLLQALAEKFAPDDKRHAALANCRKEIDDRFGIALRESFMARRAAKTTKSPELLLGTVSEALSAGEDLPELLRLSDQFAEPSDLDSSSPDTFYFHFAEMVVGLVKHLEELCTKFPERFRLLARELPYWPMLVFRHKAANNHLFQKSADGQRPLAEALELGRDCPINVSNRANYSLKTPVNSFLWRILSELLWGRGWVRSIRKGQLLRDHTSQTDIELMCERTRIGQDEAVIHFRAFDLPPLDKSTSDQWVEEVIMPWVRLKYPDLRVEPVFRSTDTGPQGRSYAAARKLILRALRNLARPAGAGWA
jgi:hypothetical protein